MVITANVRRRAEEFVDMSRSLAISIPPPDEARAEG
jgi:hypothetical protein